jgi:hypothetical protein
MSMNITMTRSRWAAIGAAVAVTLGAGGLGISHATSPRGAVAFVPITPCRVLDTRPAPDTVGPRTAPLGPGETFTVDAHGDNGDCTGIPAEATGLSLNVTALGATSGTFLTLWAADATQPTASNLNPQPGQPPTPNAVTTGISPTGQFNIFNKVGNVNVIVDVVGYYADHEHDNRYYTKAEIDARPHTMFAVVDNGGAIARQSGGVVLEARTSGQNYWLTFPEDVTACAFSATLGGSSTLDNFAPVINHLGIAAAQGIGSGASVDPDEVAVSVYEQDTGNIVDGTFSLVVTCP